MSATPSPEIAFTLSMSAGARGARGQLALAPARLGGWLDVRALELTLPELPLPLDLSGGARRFQRRRLALRRLVIAVDDRALARLIASRGAQLARRGLEDVRARITPQGVDLWGRARLGGFSAEWTARLELSLVGTSVSARVTWTRIYGPLPRPAALLADDILAALCDLPALAAQAPAEVSTQPGLEDTATFEPEASRPCKRTGLAVATIDALGLVLWHALPPAGWRLPATRELGGGRLTFAPGSMALELDSATMPGTSISEPPPAEVLLAEERLLRGDLDAATSLLRASLARQSGPAAREALLGVLLSRPATYREAESLGREMVAGSERSPAGHLALAVVALERGRTLDAVQAFERAAQAAGAGEPLVAANALVAAARVADEPARSFDLALAALEHEPRHDEALALAESMADREPARLAALRQRRAEAASDDQEASAELLRLGSLALDQLKDAERAQAAFRAALDRVPDLVEAHLGLARAAALTGDRRAARQAGTTLLERAEAAHDERMVIEALLLLGQEDEAAGDSGAALGRYARAVEVGGAQPQLLARLARAAEKSGEQAQALHAWERIAQDSRSSASVVREARLALARHELAAGRPAAAAQHLVSLDDGESLALRAQAARLQGQPAAAEPLLARARQQAQTPAERARLALLHAELLGELERGDARLAALAEAAEAAPGAAGLPALELLADSARKAGDRVALARWLDALAEELPRGAARTRILLERAQVALAAGDVPVAERLAGEVLLASPSDDDQRAAHEVLAGLRALAGDRAAQARALSEAARHAKGATAARLHLTAAELLLETGDHGGALAAARLARTADDSPAAARAMFTAAWQARAWDDLIASGAMLETVSGQDAHRLAVALEARGEIARAIDQQRNALTDPTLPAAARSQARRRLAELLEREGDPAGAARALAELAEEPDEPKPARAALHFRAAELLRKRVQDPVGAARELEAALRLDPEHMPALDALEGIHAESGDVDRVATILSRKVAAAGRQPERKKAVLARLAELQATMGRKDAAREAYRRLLELDPGHAQALAFLAQDAEEAEPAPAPAPAPAAEPAEPDLEQSIRARRAELERLARAATGKARAEALIELARVLAHGFGAPERAAACLLEALAADPARTDVLLPLAEHHAATGDPARARATLARALTADAVPLDTRPDVLLTLAELALDAREPDEALGRLDEARALRPEDPRRVRLRVRALRDAERWDSLVEQLVALAEHTPFPDERWSALHEAAALCAGPLERPVDAVAIDGLILASWPHDELAGSRRARLAGALAAARAVAPSAEALAAMADAEAARAEGHLDAAIVYLDKAWELSRTLPVWQARYALAEVTGQADDQVEWLGRRLAEQLDPPPLQARLWIKRALIYRDQLRREPEVARCLRAALVADPGSRQARRLYAGWAAARGEHALARELLERELAEADGEQGRAALHLLLGLGAEEHDHDFARAIRHLEAARGLWPDSPAPAPALARLYALAGRLPEAARAEELAAQSTADNAARAARLARAGSHWEQTGDGQEALRLYRAAADIPGASESARASVERLERLLGTAPSAARRRAPTLIPPDPDADPAEGFRKALSAALEAGDEDAAFARAHELLAVDASDPAAFVTLRRLYTLRGDVPALEHLLRERAALVADHAERAALRYDLGRLLATQPGAEARAEAAFAEALADDPSHVAALDALADAAYRSGQNERAHGLYEQLKPDASTLGAAVVWLRRGELREAVGRTIEAQQAYGQAAQANPSLLAAHEARARLALLTADLTTAMQALEALVDQLPVDDLDRLVQLRQQLGELSQRIGDTAGARRWFEQVLADEPNRVSALLPMVEIYGSAGEWALAADTLAALARLSPAPARRAELLYRMGEVARVHLGDNDRAADAYLKAIDLDASHVPTLRRLLDVYWQEGDDGQLAEIAGELEHRAALVDPETHADALARVGVLSAIMGDDRRASLIGRYLGDAGAGPVAAALAERAARKREHTVALVRAARQLCVPPGPALAAVKTVLGARGDKDPLARELASAM